MLPEAREEWLKERSAILQVEAGFPEVQANYLARKELEALDKDQAQLALFEEEKPASFTTMF